MSVSTAGCAGLARPRIDLDRLARPRRARRKYLPSRWKCAASSRASTVFGCVPAATRIVRAGSVARAYSCHTPSPSVCCSDTARPDACAALVDLDGERRQPFGEADALLQRLLHFLVVERVRRAVDQPPAVGDRRRRPTRAAARRCAAARPARAAAARSARNRARMRQELLRDRALPRSSTPTRPPRGPARRPALRSARGISRPAPDSRRATRWRCRSRSARRRPRPPAAAPACWRSKSRFAAPVSCSAIRKSDAVRTPLARPFGRSSTVGLPAPVASAMWSKPSANAPASSSVPPKRTPPYSANRSRRSSSSRIIFRKFLSQRTVMPYSATPPKPAITRSSSGSISVVDVAHRLERHALARDRDARTARDRAARS